MTSDRRERILSVIRSLGPGEVVTYGDVAADAGFPRHARVVGRILAEGGATLPWWRVVGAGGRLVPGHETEHARRLCDEGVTVRAGKVRDAPVGRFAQPPAPACRVPPAGVERVDLFPERGTNSTRSARVGRRRHA